MRRLTVSVMAFSGLLVLPATTAQAQFPVRPGCNCQGTPLMRPAQVPAPFAPLLVPPFPATPAYPVAPLPAAPCCTPQPVIQPQPMLQQSYRPVYDTTYRTQQVIAYQDVVRTEVRKEQQLVQVPVTTQRQITVDEGSYQMVWVPRQVTRNVQETILQQQVVEREVPYQVVQRVPQIVTQVIPEQTVRYVPEQRLVYGLQTGGPLLASPPVPQSASPGSSPTAPQTATQDGSQASDGNWKPIPQRQAKSSQIVPQSFEQVEQSANSHQGVPTAVQAWRMLR